MSKQCSNHGHRPTGIDDVIQQKDRAGGNRGVNAEYAIQIPTLMKLIPLRFLLFVILGFDNDRMEGELQCRGQSLRTIGDEHGAKSGRNTGHPFRPRVRLPAVPYHFHDGRNEFVTKPPLTFIVRHNVSPAGVAPTRKNPSGFGAEIVGADSH